MRQITNLNDRAPRRAGRRRGLAVATLAAATVLASVPATGQRGDDAAEPRQCIGLMDIDRTRVADDDTILFYMRGGEVYRNDLPNRCPNLDFDERFMYRVTLNRLCDSDVITVLDDFGFGFIPGASCGLGEFRPISEEEAEGLAEDRPRERGRRRR